jgi:hypothetical protein
MYIKLSLQFYLWIKSIRKDTVTTFASSVREILKVVLNISNIKHGHHSSQMQFRSNIQVHLCCRISTSVCFTAFPVGVCCMLQHTNVNCCTVWIISSDAMNPHEKVQCMEWFIKTEFDTQIQRRFRTFQKMTPSRPLIHAWHKQLKETWSVLHKKGASHP